MKRLLSLLLAVVLLTGCTNNAQVGSETSATASSSMTVSVPSSSAVITAPTVPVVPDPVQVYLDNLTLREKVGQLFIAEQEQLVSKKGAVIVVTEELKENLARYPVGGVIFFTENVQTPEQLLTLTADLQTASKIPMFISTDEEGGKITRLANNTAFGLPQYQSAAAVGSTGNPADALEMGQTIGGYLKQYGLNLDFAPVADVYTNPQNTVIGTRAFSSDPIIAGQMTKAFAEGLREKQVIATFKHFPGHGDTAQDSHYGIAVNNKTKEELQQCEWLPYQNAGKNDMVMVGHIALPNVTGNMTPATMSKEIVTDILKGELGFAGLVITDAMDMGAITQNYSAGEAALAALQAGCDIVLMPENLAEAFDAVVAAVEEGTLSMQWLEETVERILRFKAEHGILIL